MEKTRKLKLLKEILEGFNDNKTIINQAIDNEYDNGNFIELENLKKIINKYTLKIIENDIENQNKKRAIVCDGNPEIVLNAMLHSIVFENNIVIICNGYKIINEVINSIFNESIKMQNLKNIWIDYNNKYDEAFIINNQNSFEEIIYVGDYFEFENFKYGVKTKLIYNNFGYIKLYIDKSKNLNEYKEIMKYAYIHNIYIDIYNNLDDFLSEARSGDFGIAFVDNENIEKCKNSKFGNLCINKIPFEKYEFKMS